MPLFKILPKRCKENGVDKEDRSPVISFSKPQKGTPIN